MAVDSVLLFVCFWMVLLGRQQVLSTSLWSVFLQNVLVSSFIKKTLFIYLFIYPKNIKSTRF